MNLPRLHRARAFIIHKDQALVMHRIHDNGIYYTLLGGKVEPDEAPEQACIREVMEESGVTVRIERKLFAIDDIYEGIHNIHHIFECSYVSGEPVLSGEELERHTDDNQYTPMWIPRAQLIGLPLYPQCVGDALQKHLGA